MDAAFGTDPSSKCGFSWHQRSDYWLKSVDAVVPKRKRRERQRSPLILCGHGLSMRVDKHTLLIRDGKTHYPAEERSWRFFRGALDIPERVVVIDGSGNITLEALRWLSEQGVSLILLNWDGSSSTVTSPTGFVSEQSLVRWQSQVAEDPAKRLAFAKDLICKKLQACIDTLQLRFDAKRKSSASIGVLSDGIAKISGRSIKTVQDVRGIEGRVAAAYFNAWTDLDIEWRGKKQWPIPDDWAKFNSRSSLANGRKPKNRNASHPINAMLNYGYAILERQLHIQAVADGYDPTLGIMHHSYEDKPAFVFDLMEPMRPLVDRAVLELIASEAFAGNDFQLQSNGVCRLNPQLARRVVQLVTASIRPPASIKQLLPMEQTK